MTIIALLILGSIFAVGLVLLLVTGTILILVLHIDSSQFCLRCVRLDRMPICSGFILRFEEYTADEPGNDSGGDAAGRSFETANQNAQ